MDLLYRESSSDLVEILFVVPKIIPICPNLGAEVTKTKYLLSSGTHCRQTSWLRSALSISNSGRKLAAASLQNAEYLAMLLSRIPCCV